uniref:tRNA (adenine(58)-N(1))-methyltransferase non-catalytic subunit TRM6 n=1 Tax=Arion vulgaris TaxID=1028688 RepID=A0A0B7AXE2_9EUPU
MKLLEFLHPSRPVVVYCQFVEPLVECYTEIKKRGIGIQLRLSETWFREYQVLPQRTHPMMNMSGTGGYLLTFITVQAKQIYLDNKETTTATTQSKK